MTTRHTITYTILIGGIFAVFISESLALFDSTNNPSQFLLTPSVPVLPFSLLPTVDRTLPLQVKTPDSSAVSSSLQLATGNFAAGFSAPNTPIINTASITNVKTGYLTSQPSTTYSANSATGSSAIQSVASVNSATGLSASQSSATNLATGASTSNELATRSSALQTTVSGANTLQPPSVAANPIVQQFSSSISQSLVSLEILKNFADFKIEQPRDLFFPYDAKVLTNAGFQDLYLAEVVSKALDSVGVLSSPIFFTAVTNTLAKYLFSKGVLTDDTAPSLSQKFLDLVDFHANSNGVHSGESVVIAVGDGLFEFLPSLGLLNSVEDFAQFYHLVAQELEAVSLLL